MNTRIVSVLDDVHCHVIGVPVVFLTDVREHVFYVFPNTAVRELLVLKVN